MPSMRAHVFRVPAEGPDDVSGVEALFSSDLEPRNVVAILGKTEGAVKSLQHRALASLQRQMGRSAA